MNQMLLSKTLVVGMHYSHIITVEWPIYDQAFLHTMLQKVCYIVFIGILGYTMYNILSRTYKRSTQFLAIQNLVWS